jgi:coenzyme F420-reducing hydrogenase gamma subunit
MSLIDMDERILDIFERADLVYGPLVDFKDFPEDVDVCLVEGAVSSEEDLHKIRLVRERTKTLVSFGDCAVTSNVPGMRNPIGVQPLLDRAYRERHAQPADAIGHRAQAPADLDAGPPGGEGRRLPARLPAVRRPDLHHAR